MIEKTCRSGKNEEMSKEVKANSNKNDKGTIEETIVVEGRDDTQAVLRAVNAITIETHGFGISEDTWKELERANKRHGLIIFTDPDYAGKQIRKRISERFPDAKQAYISQTRATKKNDIGIENATPEDIREALKRVTESHSVLSETASETELYTMNDLYLSGLVGREDSKKIRERLSETLGLGYGNAKHLLKELNFASVDRTVFKEALKKAKE